MKHASGDRESKLVQLFAQLATAMMTRGLEVARRESPTAYEQAANWLATDSGCHFQLRIDMHPPAGFETRGLIVDESGEALIQVFSIEAAANALNLPNSRN